MLRLVPIESLITARATPKGMTPEALEALVGQESLEAQGVEPTK